MLGKTIAIGFDRERTIMSILDQNKRLHKALKDLTNWCDRNIADPTETIPLFGVFELLQETTEGVTEAEYKYLLKEIEKGDFCIMLEGERISQQTALDLCKCYEDMQQLSTEQSQWAKGEYEETAI